MLKWYVDVFIIVDQLHNIAITTVPCGWSQLPLVRIKQCSFYFHNHLKGVGVSQEKEDWLGLGTASFLNNVTQSTVLAITRKKYLHVFSVYR